VRSVFGSLEAYKPRLLKLGKWVQRMRIRALINKYALIYMKLPCWTTSHIKSSMLFFKVLGYRSRGPGSIPGTNRKKKI
jgi:hypothetical protein